MKILGQLAIAAAVAAVTAAGVAAPAAAQRCRAGDYNCRNNKLDNVEYNLETLLACVRQAKSELNGHYGQPGAGPRYYSDLNRCKGQARNTGVAGLDEATAKCNEACAEKVIAKEKNYKPRR